jgi:hypothetical protein
MSHFLIVMLSVPSPYCYAEFRYAECHYGECRSASACAQTYRQLDKIRDIWISLHVRLRIAF